MSIDEVLALVTVIFFGVMAFSISAVGGSILGPVPSLRYIFSLTKSNRTKKFGTDLPYCSGHRQNLKVVNLLLALLRKKTCQLHIS